MMNKQGEQSAKEPWPINRHYMVLFGLALLGCVILWYWYLHQTTSNPPAQTAEAAIEAVQCPRGQSKIVLMHGRDDRFAASGEEIAHIRPALLDTISFAEMAKGTHPFFGHRTYDEGGKDKFFIDHFDLPRGIISGKIMSRLRAAGDNRSDNFTLGDYDMKSRNWAFRSELQYHVKGFDPAVDEMADGEPILAIDLEVIRNTRELANGPAEFLDYLNSQSRPDGVDVIIQDDTMVDFLAFVLCQEPTEVRGTTLVEFRGEPSLPDISLFSCAQDFTLPSCNPFSGDHVCSTPASIACYKDGNRKSPPQPTTSNINMDAFVGGEIRLSTPVRPDSFAKLAQANSYCAAQFGDGWRVASYHEASGAQIVSYSDLPAGARGLVHVADQAYGNCWDRPESVVRP